MPIENFAPAPTISFPRALPEASRQNALAVKRDGTERRPACVIAARASLPKSDKPLHWETMGMRVR
jgi:hypothetical protein